MTGMTMKIIKDEVKQTKNSGGMAIGTEEEWNRVGGHITGTIEWYRTDYGQEHLHRKQMNNGANTTSNKPIDGKNAKITKQHQTGGQIGMMTKTIKGRSLIIATGKIFF